MGVKPEAEELLQELAAMERRYWRYRWLVRHLPERWVRRLLG
jgi:hypothetical protein